MDLRPLYLAEVIFFERSVVMAKNSSELCQMFGSEPGLKTVMSLPWHIWPKNCRFLHGFTTTSRLKCNYLRNETSY